MKKLIFLLLVIVSTVLHAQVNKRTGLLIDTLTTTELNSLNDKFKISGSLFYDDTLKSFVTYKNGGWVSLGGSGGSTYTAGDGLTLTDTEFGIADAGVTNLKLQNGSVTNDKIAFFTINPTRLNVNVNQNPVPADMVPVTLAADEFTFKPYITSPFSNSITGYRFAPNLLYFDQIHIKNKTQDNNVATSSIALSSVEDPDNSGDYYGYIGLAKPSTGAGDRITGVPSSYSVLGTTNNVKIGQATSTAPAEKLFVEGNIDITGDYLINGTPIGSGGGTDDQTLSEVLAEGNDANGEDFLNTGSISPNDVYQYLGSSSKPWFYTFNGMVGVKATNTQTPISGYNFFKANGDNIVALTKNDGSNNFLNFDISAITSSSVTIKATNTDLLFNGTSLLSGSGSDSGQGWYLNNQVSTETDQTLSNSNFTQSGSATGKKVWNRYGNAKLSLENVSLQMYSARFDATNDSLIFNRADDMYFITYDSIIKGSDYIKIPKKATAYVTYLRDSSSIKLYQIDVADYTVGNYAEPSIQTLYNRAGGQGYEDETSIGGWSSSSATPTLETSDTRTGTTALRITSQNNNVSDFSYWSTVVNGTTGQTYTFSGYLKALSGTEHKVLLYQGGTVQTIDLSSGAFEPFSVTTTLTTDNLRLYFYTDGVIIADDISLTLDN